MDDLQKKRAAELHDQGIGRNAIAREIGVEATAVTRWAQKEGLTFDRSKTATATRANIVDGAQRRQNITRRIYDMLERTLDRAEYEPPGGWTTILRVKGGGETISPVNELPLRDLRDLGSTVNTLSYAAAALERANAIFNDQDGLDRSRSLLAGLAHAFGLDTTNTGA